MYLDLRLTNELREWQKICAHYEGDWYYQNFEARIWEMIRHYEYGAVPSMDNLIRDMVFKDVSIIVGKMVVEAVPILFNPFACLTDHHEIDGYEFTIEGNFFNLRMFLVGEKNGFKEQITNLASVKTIINKIKAIEPSLTFG